LASAQPPQKLLIFNRLSFEERTAKSNVDKLRASPERSEGEDQFSVACEGKFNEMTETGSKTPLDLSTLDLSTLRSDKLYINV
jgi:hypothetical protein